MLIKWEKDIPKKNIYVTLLFKRLKIRVKNFLVIIWYPIDLTWGSGHIEGIEFIKEFNEFFFCINPELRIQTHFPENEKF